MTTEARTAVAADYVRRLTEARTIAIVGIAFGALALWIALPPWSLGPLVPR